MKPPFWQVALHFRFLSSKEDRELWSQFQERKKEHKNLTGRDFLLEKGILTSSQAEKLFHFLQRGYLLCPTCQIAYGLPNRKMTSLPPCPQCRRTLKLKGKGEELEVKTSSQTNFETPGREVNRAGPSLQHSSRPNRLQPKSAPLFKVDKVLGQGGYGVVYQVKEDHTDREVALKVLHHSKMNKPKVRRRFEREIQVTSILEHPNIMPLYRCGYLENGTLYFCMKKLPGGTLSELIKSEKFDNLAYLLDIFLKVCQGLEYAHAHRVIHRDLKPSNIAVGDFGEVIVMDWGLARMEGWEEEERSGEMNWKEASSQEVENLTQDGSMLGTPGYMSPEQAEGQRANERSDIFSLGAILYQILTGEPPFTGGVRQRVVATLMEDPTPPGEISPRRELPGELSAIAMKALAKNPEERYQSVGELRRDILRYQEGHSVSAKEDSPWEKIRKWIFRNRALSLGLAACFMVAIFSGIAFVQWQKFDRSRQIDRLLRRAEERITQPQVLSYDQLKGRYREQNLYGEEPEELRRLREKSLESYSRAKSLLDKAWELGGKREEVGKKLFQVEREMGKLALLGQNYLMSRLAFSRCRRLGYEEEGKKLLARIEEVRQERREKKLARIEKIVEKLRQGPPDKGVKETCVTQLVRLPGKEVVKKLLSYVESPHRWVRLVAIEALGKLGDRETTYRGKDTVEWLLKRLEKCNCEDHPKEAETLVWALGRLRDSRANEAVKKLRRSQGPASLFWKRTRIPYRWIPSAKKAQIGKSSDKGEEKDDIQQRGSRLLDRGLEKLSKGQYEKAEEIYTRFLEIYPNHRDALSNRANTYMKRDQYKKAIRDLKRALSIQGDSGLYSNLGFSYLKIREFKKALDSYQQALKFDSQNVLALLGQAEALAYFERFEEALDSIDKAVQIKPRSAEVYSARGRILNAMKKYHLAIQNLNKSLKINDSLFVSYIRRGIAYHSLKNYDRALADYNRAIELNPRHYLAYFHRGRLHHDKGRFDRAEKDYERALKFKPHKEDVFLRRGTLYSQREEFQKALKDFNRGIELNPRRGAFYFNRATTLVNLGEKKKALVDYNRAEKLGVRHPGLYLYRGMIYYQFKKLDRALRDYNTLIKLDGERFPKAYLYRARILDEMGRPSQVISDLKKYLQLRPGSPNRAQIEKYIKVLRERKKE